MTNFVQVSDRFWMNADEVTHVVVFEEVMDSRGNNLRPSVWKVGFRFSSKRDCDVRVASKESGIALAQRFAREVALGANRDGDKDARRPVVDPGAPARGAHAQEGSSSDLYAKHIKERRKKNGPASE